MRQTRAGDLQPDFGNLLFGAVVTAEADVLHRQRPGEFRHRSGGGLRNGTRDLPFRQVANDAGYMQWFGPGWDDTGCKRQDSKNEQSRNHLEFRAVDRLWRFERSFNPL